jgi:hypothetical protein
MSSIARLYGYPLSCHIRLHGPAGYTRYQRYKPWLRDEFEFRCVYCLTREKWSDWGDFTFGVEHILAKSRKEHAHLECEYTNVVYACNRCNQLKGTETFIDPCSELFGEHLYVDLNGEFKWLTAEGEKIVRKLRLNDAIRMDFRKRLIRVYMACMETPDGATARLVHAGMGYPVNLPDLSKESPPTNLKPQGIHNSHFEQKKRGELPDTY